MQDLSLLQKIAEALGGRLIPPKIVIDEVVVGDGVILCERSQTKSFYNNFNFPKDDKGVKTELSSVSKNFKK
jgi:hypothetical protein